MSILKKILHAVYYFGNLPEEKVNFHQKIIRDTEWASVRHYMKEGSLFLDVGCGTGYSLKKAKEDLGCKCFGVDPVPNRSGVHFNNNDLLNISEAIAEKLPFRNKSFDIVFSSHVLAHVSDQSAALQEMKRVLKDNGILVLSVPTATMAYIRFISMVLFTTHQRIARVLLKPFINTGNMRFKHIFLPPSNSNPDNTILRDLFNYRLKNWSKIIVKEFTIKKVVFPGLYLYPDFIVQLSEIKKFNKYSSSYFFICEK